MSEILTVSVRISFSYKMKGGVEIMRRAETHRDSTFVQRMALVTSPVTLHAVYTSSRTDKKSAGANINIDEGSVPFSAVYRRCLVDLNVTWHHWKHVC